MRWWVWNVIIAVVLLMIVVTNLKYDGSPMMGGMCMAVTNTLFMAFILYSIEAKKVIL